MALNLSNFPEQIDTFVSHLDLGSTDVPNLQRFEALRIKDTLTSVESEEMATLFSALREKLFLAEDLNKLQDCITNLQTFFKYQTETYINEKFQQYDDRMVTMENNAQYAVANLNEKMNECVAWVTEEKATMHDSTYFDFDNMSYRNGFTVITETTSTGYSESLRVVADNSVYATRVTIRNGTNNYTVKTTCDKVIPAVNITEHIYKENGVWYTTVI